MKNYIILLLLVVTSLHAQESYLIEYQKEISFTEDYLEQLDKKQRMQLERFGKNKMNYTLQTNGIISQYQFLKKIDNRQEKSGIYLTGDNNIYYKNISKKKYIQPTKIYSQKIVIEDNLPQFNWKITNEVEIHLGYTVKKALSNYNDQEIEAWFCEEIPISDGPTFYYGLPGLILKIKAQRNNRIEIFSASKIEAQQESLVIKFPKEKETVTFEEYEEKRIKARDNYFEMISQDVDTSD